MYHGSGSHLIPNLLSIASICLVVNFGMVITGPMTDQLLAYNPCRLDFHASDCLPITPVC